jgi:quercetin dioxygenase-like cupin family protein
MSLLSDEQIFLSPSKDVGVVGVPIWETDGVPISNAGGIRWIAADDLGFRTGSVFRVTELEPGSQTAMHRSPSIDYCTVLSGELELLLDGGETVSLSPGDTVAQRGTWHAWRNPNKEKPSRFVMCMIEAKPIHAFDRAAGPLWSRQSQTE